MARKSFKIRSNLAEALHETVSSAKNNAGELHVEVIPLRKIVLDPENPRDLALTTTDLYDGLSNSDAHFRRKTNEKEALESLAKSIAEQGVINSILVYKLGEQYCLVAGERRTFASILAGKADIPAKILPARPDPLKLSLLQWIENIEREDLSLWERLRNLEKILNAYAKTHQKKPTEITPTELGQLLGCSLQQAVNYRHLLNAPKELRSHLESGEIKNIEKAAFISNSAVKTQPMLIQACLNGATLSEMKKLSRQAPSNSNSSEIKNNSNAKINFGRTSSKEAAKVIISTVLEHENFKHLSDKFMSISWDDPRSIAMAFRQLVKLLEKA